MSTKPFRVERWSGQADGESEAGPLPGRWLCVSTCASRDGAHRAVARQFDWWPHDNPVRIVDRDTGAVVWPADDRNGSV